MLGSLRLIMFVLLTAIASFGTSPGSHAQSPRDRSADQLIQSAAQARIALRHAEALRFAEQAVVLLEKGDGAQIDRLPTALHLAGNILVELGRPLEAIERHQRALALREAARAPDELVSEGFANLAAAYAQAIMTDQALAAQEKAIERAITTDPKSFVRLYRLEAQRGAMLVTKENFAEARKALEFAIKGLEGRSNDPAAQFSLPEALASYAVVLAELGEQASADATADRAIQTAGKVYAHNLTHTAIANMQIARARVAAKHLDYVTGLTYAGRARDINLKALGAAHPDVGLATAFLYNYHNEAGWFEPLKSTVDADLKIVDTTLPDHHPLKAENLGVMARTLAGLSRPDEAAALYKRALQIDTAVTGDKKSDKRAILLNNLSHIAFEQDRFDEAEALMRESWDIAKANHGAGSIDAAEKLSNLAMIQSGAGRPAEAISGLSAARRVMERHYPPDHPTLGRLYYNLGAVFLELDQPTEAEPRLLQARTILAKHLTIERDTYTQVLDRLIETSGKLKKPADTAKWQAEHEKVTGTKK